MTSSNNRRSAKRPGKPLTPGRMIRSGLCIGCGSCAAALPDLGAEMVFDRYGQLRPVSPPGRQRPLGAEFSKLCPFSPAAANEDHFARRLFPDAQHQDPRLGRFESTYVGHVEEGEYRSQGSSGGMVTWVADELLRLGMVDGVAHVAARDPGSGDDRLFRYRIARDSSSLRDGAKSRYYPVELSDIIRTIKAVPGRYAIVGIPCFIKAVRLLADADPEFGARVVFTLGLFCGHMKSARMAESFTWQMGRRIEEVRHFDFRVKDARRPANWYRAGLNLSDGSQRSEDWWHFADGDWGAGFFQSTACNACDDVVAETADISFGDAWVEPYSSDGRGTNVVITRSKVLDALISESIEAERLALSPVDADFVAGTQAAGFRHRREGLAFRLAWPQTGVRPRKRVEPSLLGLPPRRAAIYLMRFLIARWSHRWFWMARVLRLPGLYLTWASLALRTYQGLAYSRGRVGRLADRLFKRGGEA